MSEVFYFFRKLFDYNEWSSRWQSGNWTDFHAWFYITSDLLTAAVFISIAVLLGRYRKKRELPKKIARLYFCFIVLALACSVFFILDAITFWTPFYRLNALVLFIAGLSGCCTLFFFIKDVHLARRYISSEHLNTSITGNYEEENEIKKLNLELIKRMKVQSEELAAYKYALDESSIFAITNQKGIITYVNENFCKISKYTKEELLGQDHRIINSGYHPAEYIRNIWVTIANGKIWKGQLRNRAKDGSIYWVDTTIVPFLNDAGKPYQYVAIRSDITEKKKIEEKQALYELVVNSSADAIITQSKEDIITSWNKGASDIFGYSEEEALGQSIDIVIPKFILQQVNKLKATVIFDVGEKHYETQCRHKDGHTIDMFISCSQLKDLAGNVIGLTIIGRDITAINKANEEQKKSEKIYKTIASNIPGSAICLFDKQYRYILIEGDMVEKMGFNRDQMLMKNIDEVITGPLLTTVKDSLQKVFAGEAFDAETNDDMYDVLTKWIPLKDEHNTVFNALTLSIDVTDLKKAQKEVEDLNKTLEKKVAERTQQLHVANKELESFSYSISHDLRAPLRAINGYTKIIEEDYCHLFDNEGQRILTAIKSNASRMGMLIDDLLNFSKTGRKELSLVKINMGELVKNCANELLQNQEAGRYKIQVKNITDAYGDIAMLRQVWLNLIGNAIKYSAKKENPEIKIECTTNNKQIIYSIKDNGAGFNMKYADKLFGVFQRLHSMNEFEGTGVGLALVKRIIEKHNGRIWAEAAEGEGATFHFSLPEIFG